MIEFADIRIRAALPLHPYLAEHPHLSLRLVAGDKVCRKTPGVSGDLVTGTWTFNSRLSVPVDNQSLTIAVMTGVKNARIQAVSVTVKVAELLARVKDQENDFDIFDSFTPLQLKLVMTCYIKFHSVTSGCLRGIGNVDHAVDKPREETQPHKSGLPSREELKACYAKAIRMSDQDDSKACTLNELGRVYYTLYREKRRRADLEKAVSLHEEAMQFTGRSHPQLAEHAYNFSMALVERFKESEDPVDIERAVSHFQTALEFTPDLNAQTPARLSWLGNALQLRFQRMGNPADMENSISCQRKAIELTPDGHPDKTSHLGNLVRALQCRFERLGSLTDIDDAISNKQKAVELTPDGHSHKPGLLSNLGVSPQSRFERLGTLADIEDATLNFRKAVELTPDDHLHKPVWLNNLGNALQSRFECLDRLVDVDDAILDFRKAVELTPDDHPDKPGRLSKLGNALQSRSERLSSGITDIEEAITNFQKAVKLTPDNHPNRPGRLGNLGNALQLRFQRRGGLADLEDTIWNTQRAIELTLDGHRDKPGLLGNLGIALRLRFERLGSLADIEGAISWLRKAAEMTPVGHPDKPARLNNLGGALQMRFGRLQILADLRQAISYAREAVELTPDGHADKSIWLNNLGSALQLQSEHLGSLADIEDAISGLQKVIKLTPDDHPDKASRLSNLGGALQTRFEHLGILADLSRAISALQKAVKLTPDGHSSKANWLSNLGGGFLARYKHLGILSDLESALSALSTAAKSPSGSAMVRFEAARSWADVASKNYRSPLDAFSCAIGLLPRIAWLGLAVTDQHALLADVGGIVRDAVAAAIRYKEYETAIVWAEQGRSIVWQNLLGLRSPVDDLHRAHPQLADRLQILARQLEGSESHDAPRNEGQAAPVENVSRGYSKLAVEWDTLIEEIRGLPNFEGFLKAKGFSQLASAAHEGPVVILNVNDSQCDALVLIPANSVETCVSVINISLERFSYEKAKKLFQALTGLLKSAGVRERSERTIRIGGSQLDREAKFKTILRILWQDVVKPVIEGLALQTESKRPPRIWWCATGLLAFLPIHAAGLYDTQEIGEKISDYVVSSYTSTLTAILELSEPAVQEDFQVLMVAQASAPGAPPIPKTEDEVRIVHRLTAGAQRVDLMKENATVERVREGMMESNWIHLACHGQQNPDDPMESGFLLHDKILKLSEIIKMSLPKADFAFLSACQTAMGDEKVAEESVHLAAGMFLSGCRGVIATTWSIRDDDAPKIAEDVYSRIFKDGKPNRKEAAYALHEAVKRLRESGAQCTSWVPFIHIGR